MSIIMAATSLISVLAGEINVMEPPPLSVQVLEEVAVVLRQEVFCSDGEQRDGETKYEADTCRAWDSQVNKEVLSADLLRPPETWSLAFSLRLASLELPGSRLFCFVQLSSSAI